jgi:hypothetical protein
MIVFHQESQVHDSKATLKLLLIFSQKGLVNEKDFMNNFATICTQELPDMMEINSEILLSLDGHQHSWKKMKRILELQILSCQLLHSCAVAELHNLECALHTNQEFLLDLFTGHRKS